MEKFRQLRQGGVRMSNTALIKMKTLHKEWQNYKTKPHSFGSTCFEKECLSQTMVKYAEEIIEAIYTARGLCFMINTFPIKKGYEQEWIDIIKENAKELEENLSQLDNEDYE